jgi:hypothetical protein
MVLSVTPTASGGGQIDDFPVIVELAKSQLTYSLSASAQTTFANGGLPKKTNGGAYVWNVVSLDSTGWGNGTTIDVAGFNQAASTSTAPSKAVSDTWPEFLTQ